MNIRMIFDWLAHLWSTPEEALSHDSFATDIPILSSKDDLLDRTRFANELARIIYAHRSSESLVVALRGDWGSGKTSIKNIVVEALKSADQGSMRVIEFNPWQWGDGEAITRAFFREIAVALGDTDKSLSGRRRAYEFRRYANLLNQFSNHIKKTSGHSNEISGWINMGALLLVGTGLLLPQISGKQVFAAIYVVSVLVVLARQVLVFLGRDREDDRPLEFARMQLQERLKTLKRNMLIVIDDIDRLEPDQIRTVIRHVKSNVNLPGLTYFLLFQRDIIERALSVNFDQQEGRAYLEKIVQASYDVPSVEGLRVERICLQELQQLIVRVVPDQVEFDEYRWGNVWRGGLRYFFHNLRDVKRYLGSLGNCSTLCECGLAA